ncbi:hypothetical protein ABNG02_02065 [Halorubrum ejinorense]|uniref:Uncharacterized protein n=1 Tax=Halorubrum ejinorense TaxID=425309 RepID=A0AAV3SNI4_9EURY
MTESHDNADPAAQRDEQASVEELIESHFDTFSELADSNLPISEDAEKAIALTDGGEDQ